MKLRIKGNSVRMRITKSDLESLKQHGQVVEATQFGTSTFNYRLQQSKEHDQLFTDFQQQELVVYLPQAFAETMLQTDKVGYNYTQDNGTADGLFILIEKDFKCLDDTWEDQSDMWDNPNDQCQPVVKT